jgi:hypothetical protein
MKSNNLKPQGNIRFKIIVFIYFTFCCFISYSQEESEKINENIYVGFGVGPETGLSFILPKISYYKFNDREFIENYYGIEGSVNIIGAAMFSADFVLGIKKNVLTFDNSIGVWWYPKTKEEGSIESTGPYFHCTMNPKLGIKVWRLWLKAGPGIFLYREYAEAENKPPLMNLTKFGNVYYNIEILFRPE